MSAQIDPGNAGNIPAGGPQGAGSGQDQISDQVTQLLQTLGLDTGGNEFNNPVIQRQNIERILNEDPSISSEIVQVLEQRGENDPQQRIVDDISRYLREQSLPTTPENVREAVAAQAQALIATSSGDTINELQAILNNLNVTNNRSSLTVNNPSLPGPSGTIASNNTAAADAIANPWLQPNPLATFFAVILEVVAIQAQQRLEEGLNQAEQILNNWETAQERSELTLQQGRLEAQRQLAQAIVSLVTAGVSLGVAAATFNSSKQARRNVENRKANLENNQNFNKLEGATQQDKINNGIKKYETAQKNIEANETVLKNSTSIPDKIVARQKLASARSDAEKYKPGHKDIEGYLSENNSSQASTNETFRSDLSKLQTDQQANFQALENPQTFEQEVSSEANRLSSFYRGLGDSINGIGQAVNGFIGANFEERIAEVRAILVLFDELQQTFNRAYQSAQGAKDEFANLVQQFTNFLNQIIQAYTGVFGFQGGRVV